MLWRYLEIAAPLALGEACCAAGQVIVCQAVPTSKLRTMLITPLALLPGQKLRKALIILENQYMLDDNHNVGKSM